MTNYQGWTNEIDISNSTELSSMIFMRTRILEYIAKNYIIMKIMILIIKQIGQSGKLMMHPHLITMTSGYMTKQDIIHSSLFV